MSLDDRLEQFFNEYAVEEHDRDMCKQALLLDLLEIIGEPQKIRYDDWKDNVALAEATNKLRKGLRDKVRKYCE